MNAPVRLDRSWMHSPGKPHRLAPCCKEAIEGARAQDALHRAQRMAPPSDLELERNALGLALIGDARIPGWLEPKHFFAIQHQQIFAAARAAGALDLAAERLRGVATGAELSALVDEAVHAVAMGWALDWRRLVELTHQRALLLAMERIAIRVRAGELDHAGAVGELREHVRS